MQLCDKILPREKELSDTEGRLLYRHHAVYMLCCPPERMRKGGRKGEDSERARQRDREQERARKREIQPARPARTDTGPPERAKR